MYAEASKLSPDKGIVYAFFVYNLAIEDAAENAEGVEKRDCYDIVNKDSILSLKI